MFLATLVLLFPSLIVVTGALKTYIGMKRTQFIQLVQRLGPVFIDENVNGEKEG